MDQWDRDQVELGDEARGALHEECEGHPDVRQMHIRRRVRHAQNLADITATYDRVYGA
jgi:hypothetical protein